MSTAPYAAIDDDFDLPADRINDCLKLIEWRPGTIELATSMIRYHERGGPDVDAAPGVID